MKLLSVEMACLLGVQNEIQAVWGLAHDPKLKFIPSKKSFSSSLLSNDKSSFIQIMYNFLKRAIF